MRLDRLTLLSSFVCGLRRERGRVTLLVADGNWRLFSTLLVSDGNFAKNMLEGFLYRVWANVCASGDLETSGLCRSLQSAVWGELFVMM